jgi:hypothetical protein
MRVTDRRGGHGALEAGHVIAADCATAESLVHRFWVEPKHRWLDAGHIFTEWFSVSSGTIKERFPISLFELFPKDPDGSPETPANPRPCPGGEPDRPWPLYIKARHPGTLV